MPTYAVIIPAAGQSSRFGGLEKKPFVSLDGRPIWLRTCELFWNRPEVAKVYLVLDASDRDDFRARFGHLLAFANAQIVNGGAERFESVGNALAEVPTDVDFVAVHDAVRPLTLPAQIDAVFAAAAQHGAAMLAVPLADTLKRVEPETNRVLETVSRTGLWQAQTPQVFRRDWLVDAYKRLPELPGPITDNAQLIEAAGYAVHVVPGSLANLKITTRDDLTLADAVLKGRTPKAADAKPLRAFDDEAKW